MLSSLPSIPYGPIEKGYWYPVTATLNWCEEEYYSTIYIAEIVNTLTNVLFVYLAFRGLYNCWKHGHDSIFVVTFLGYLLVGLGSFSFHCTLKYPMQLVDELSMIYSTCLMCHATLSYAQSRIFSMILAFGLVALAIFITLYYHYLQDPAFHQNAYAILTAIVVFRSMYMMEWYLRPALRSNDRILEPLGDTLSSKDEDSVSQKSPDEQILKEMWKMVAVGLTVFLGGFAIWTLDNEYCSSLRSWRHRVGLPWGILSEGHGWWHLMTGVGAYFYIVWGIWLRHCLDGHQDEYVLDWPSVFFSLPDVIKRQDTSTSLSRNGSRAAKKDK